MSGAQYSVVVQTIRLDYSSNNVTTAAYVQLDSALDRHSDAIEISDTGGSSMKLAVGPASGEVDAYTYAAGGPLQIIPMPLSLGQRLSIRAVGSNVSSGELIINLWR